MAGPETDDVWLARVLSALDDAHRQRRAFAAQLHDDVIQTLTAALLRLDLVDVQDPQLDAVRAALDDAVRSLRATMEQLAPSYLQGDDLAAALRAALRDVVPNGEVSSSPVHVSDDGLERVPAVLLDSMVRMVRDVVAALASTELPAGLDVTVRHEDRRVEGSIRCHTSPDVPGRLGPIIEPAVTVVGGGFEIREEHDGISIDWWVPSPPS